ncbi:MAG: HD-GYP domain-containing protein [Gammaproteobacteria bacterium]|nr:HD-GYP domain-containing protein [Gammaproteobacteria bacterium]
MIEKKISSGSARTVKKFKLNTDQLEIGMFVCELDCPWEDTDFLMQGFTIDSQRDIKVLQARCRFVYVEIVDEKCIEIEKRATGSPVTIKKRISSEKVNLKKQRPLESEIQQASHSYVGAKKAVQSFMGEVIRNKSIDIQEARAVVSDCMGSVSRNPDAMMLLSQLKNKDEYTSQHSLNVCLYSLMLGQRMGLAGHELETVGLCGMLHDMGKLRTPIEVLNKPGKLTDEEFQEIKRHPVHGREILLSSEKTVDQEVVDAAYMHHERLRGGGYPEGLTEVSISFHTRIVTIADVYDAITSARVYDGSRSHLEATRILTENRGKEFDEDMVIRFIAGLGLYPPGSFLEMTNGEVAIVLENHSTSRLMPKLLRVMGADKTLTEERIIDLADEPRDEAGQRYAVASVLPQEAYGVSLKAYYQRGLFANISHL